MHRVDFICARTANVIGGKANFDEKVVPLVEQGFEARIFGARLSLPPTTVARTPAAWQAYAAIRLTPTQRQ